MTAPIELAAHSSTGKLSAFLSASLAATSSAAFALPATTIETATKTRVLAKGGSHLPLARLIRLLPEVTRVTPQASFDLKMNKEKHEADHSPLYAPR
jgi:hypothetical protein